MVVVHMSVSPTADIRTSQVIAINELLALGFANLGGAICGAVPTQPLGWPRNSSGGQDDRKINCLHFTCFITLYII